MKKTKPLGYYARKVVYCERSIAQENNKIIRQMYKIMKLYYTRKWERWYD